MAFYRIWAMGFAHYVNCIHLSIVVELRRKDVLGVEIALNLIAIMGFLLSVYNFALELYKRHKRITIEIKHVFRIADVEDILHLQIINQSSTSICISRLKLTCDGKSVYYGDYRKLITEVTKRTGQTITCRETQTAFICSSPPPARSSERAFLMWLSNWFLCKCHQSCSLKHL